MSSSVDLRQSCVGAQPLVGRSLIGEDLFIRMKEIIICESWCRGFEHVEFNAAFLRTVNLAFPEANLLFLSEQEHGVLVQQRLQSIANLPITYGCVPVPQRGVPNLRQFFTEVRACWQALSLVGRSSAHALIFTCLRGPSLLAVKALIRPLGVKIPTVGIVHGELGSLLTKPLRRPWNRVISLRSVLKWPTPSSLRLIVLGDSINREVAQLLPAGRHVWRSLEHPYLWSDYEPPSNPTFAQGRSIRFGFLGASSKGLEEFCRIAQIIKSEFPEAIFEMIGFVGNKKPSTEAMKYISGISDSPLASKEYRKRLEGLTYCLWLGDPKHYRLTASGTFLDALASAKPCIALSNSYLTHYFKVLGDIGYLCESVDEMCACIKGILKQHPEERYAKQMGNIVRGRNIFAPDQVARKLRDIFSEMAMPAVEYNVTDNSS